MANTFLGQFPIEVGTEVYILTLGFNAMCTLEDRYDMPILKIAAKVEDEERFSDVRAFVWAALQEHQPSITENQAGDLIQTYGVAKIIALLPQVIAAAFPPQEDGKAKPGPRKKSAPRSGRTSTVS